MTDIPKFKIYGEDNIEELMSIQPQLNLRSWDEIPQDEKVKMLELLIIDQFLENYLHEVAMSVSYLNRRFMRVLPGKFLHHLQVNGTPSKEQSQMEAYKDFKILFVRDASHALFFVMLSVLARNCIDTALLSKASKQSDLVAIEHYEEQAYKKFHALKNRVNEIFKQFSVNMFLTQTEIVPKQDEKIVNEIYEPTLKVLSDPKWKPVSSDLGEMFNDYNEQNYPEAITKASSAVHRFLQILVGDQNKNGKGQYGKLFNEAKEKGYISDNHFVDGIVTTIKGFIPRERAAKGTAKPSFQDATSSDVLLVMNVVMVLLQHCLQNLGEIN